MGKKTKTTKTQKTVKIIYLYFIYISSERKFTCISWQKNRRKQDHSY